MSESVSSLSPSLAEPSLRRRWVFIVGAAIGLKIVLIAAAYLYMVVYSYGLRPGETLEHYQAVAQDASPVVALVVGVPLFFLAGFWLGRRTPGRGVRTGLWLWAIYLLLDLPLLGVFGVAPFVTPISIANYLTKLVAAYGGGWWAERRAAA